MRSNYLRIGLRVKALLGIIIPLAGFFLLLGFTGHRSPLVFGAALAALAGIFLLGLDRAFISPLKKLRRAAALADGGRFEMAAAADRSDEFGELAGSIAGMCDRLQKHQYDLEQRVGELTLLYNISKVASSAVDLDRALETMLEGAVKVTQGVSGFIMLTERSDNGEAPMPKLKVSLGVPAGEAGHIFISREIVRYVIEHGGPLLLAGDISRRGFQPHPGLKDAIYSPIRFGDEIIGVIGLINKQDGDFNQKDLQLLLTLANQASGVINAARLFVDLQASYFSTVQALSAAIDAKDPYTRGHSGRVVGYCRMIAGGMGYSKAEMEAIEIAAYLHDIGKIGIDERILQKPRTLSAREYEVVKSHSTISAKILGGVAFLRDALPIVRHHHEHYDGCGYPDGLTGERIPLGARIISVADSFDAMTSDRPYRQALSSERALEELKTCAGAQFDPNVVDAFIKQAVAAAGRPALFAYDARQC